MKLRYKPLKKYKRPGSVWLKSFKCNGRMYPLIQITHMIGETEPVYVLKTGEGETDYEVVYPDEVEEVEVKE